MSDTNAPNAARQSPEPETQSKDQTSAIGSGNISDDKGEKGGSKSTSEQKSSDETKMSGLESNPEGPLEGAAKEKVSKEH